MKEAPFQSYIREYGFLHKNTFLRQKTWLKKPDFDGKALVEAVLPYEKGPLEVNPGLLVSGVLNLPVP